MTETEHMKGVSNQTEPKLGWQSEQARQMYLLKKLDTVKSQTACQNHPAISVNKTTLLYQSIRPSYIETKLIHQNESIKIHT